MLKYWSQVLTIWPVGNLEAASSHVLLFWSCFPPRSRAWPWPHCWLALLGLWNWRCLWERQGTQQYGVLCFSVVRWCVQRIYVNRGYRWSSTGKRALLV
jgi:hypothetical protein